MTYRRTNNLNNVTASLASFDAFAARPYIISGDGYNITHCYPQPIWSAFPTEKDTSSCQMPITQAKRRSRIETRIARDGKRRHHKQEARRARIAQQKRSDETLLELRKQFKTARKSTKRLKNKIYQYLNIGNERKATEAQHKLLSSFHANLMAFEKANNKLKAKYRLLPEQLIEEAEQINVFELEVEPVRLRLQVKENSPTRIAYKLRHKEHRLIQSFGIRHKARQYICKMALEPFLLRECRVDQFGIQGTRQADAIHRIASAIECGELRYFVELDIRNFFANIGNGQENRTGDHTYQLNDWLPLPEKVIQSSMLSKQ